MIKEIVSFGRELRNNGIYDLLNNTVEQKQQKKYDIILVILDVENDQVLSHRTIKVINSKKKEYFMDLYKKYTRPIADENNKALGGGCGLDTASHFSFRYQWTKPEKFKNAPYTDVLIEKWQKTFREGSNSINEINTMLSYFNENYESIIKDIIDKADTEDKTPFIIFFWYGKYPPQKMEQLLSEDYSNYSGTRSFKNSKTVLHGDCFACGTKNTTIGLPATFNNANDNIPYLKHSGRKMDLNIAVCAECAQEINDFNRFFLKRVSIFPLFINTKLREKTFAIMKQNGEKLGFREIIEEVYRQAPSKEFDFYLIIQNKEKRIINIDYISGFRFKREDDGMSVFDVEDLINISFFADSENHGKLTDNYFKSDMKIKEKDLEALIYKYRTQIFDYVYRARYNAINKSHILDMYIASLLMKFKYSYNPKAEEPVIISRIKKMNDNFLKLDQYFGGGFMSIVSNIKEDRSITTPESAAYYIGQVVYYLISQSQKEDKKLSMIDSFVYIPNFNVLTRRLMELLEAYSHAINKDNRKFRNIISRIFEFLCENKSQKFDSNLKAFFYMGFFNDNIFFEKNSEKTEETEKIEKEEKDNV